MLKQQQAGSAKMAMLAVACATLTACGGGEELGDTLDKALGRASWTNIATEGQTFTFTKAGTYTVRFGASGAWVQKAIVNTAACSVATFGSDPAPGALKSCQVKGTAGVTLTGTAGSTSTAATTTTTTSTTTTTPVVDGSLPWSDPATWGGVLPTAGAEVVVPAGKIITLDTTPPNLAGLRIEGTLRFARQDLQLTTGYIDLTGALEIGTASAPFTHKAVITLNGAPQTTNDGVSRGLNVRGGRLEIYGTAPIPTWTKLNDHAQAGATALTLKDATTNWRAGDTIAVGPTDWYGVAATERLALSAVNGAQLSLAAPLAKFRWGKMQYVTNSGMSLTPDPTFVPPATPAPTELDERAPVANLTRNIVIQGADDSAWQTTGFGAHVMVMNLASKVVVDGVEIRRAGQAGQLARYPFHWHMLSYANGQLLGDATGHVIKNSAVWQSSQRCIVLHATNGVEVRNNVCQDVKGHAYFLEDAVERRNVFDGNLALTIRQPLATKRLQLHEVPSWKRGPSGYWLTNPDNTVTNNHSADAEGNGFWLAFARKPLGLSTGVIMLPHRLPHGAFFNNTAHSNLNPGLLLDFPPIDDAGTISENKYIPTSDGLEDNGSNRIRFELKRITSFKNNNNAYRNRVSAPDYVEWVTADNIGTHFSGAGDRGTITRGLMVGTSLNNFTPYPSTGDRPAAFASYHSTFIMKDNTVVNFPNIMGQPSGVLRLDDYYTNAIEVGTAFNTNNRLIATGYGFRSLPPNMDGLPLNNRHWTYAGALLDSPGAVGPAGNWWVYNTPFLTAGRPCQLVETSGANGASCAGPYYGVQNFKTDFDPSFWTFMAPIDVRRVDSTGGEIGNWSVADGTTSTSLNWMRHFAATIGGRYILRFPGKPPAKEFYSWISNVTTASDSFLLAVSFDGSLNASGMLSAFYHEGHIVNWSATSTDWQYVRQIKPASSLAEVLASSGELLWQDRPNNLVWIKVQGGLPYPSRSAPKPSYNDDFGIILKPHRLIIRGAPATAVADTGDLNKIMEATASGGFIKWIADGIDDIFTTLTLTAEPTVQSTQSSLTYTVSVTEPVLSDMAITLSNGAVISILAGESKGTSSVNLKDLIVQDGYFQVYVVNVLGGGLGRLAINDSAAITRLTVALDPSGQ